jgi:hypothetical protein
MHSCCHCCCCGHGGGGGNSTPLPTNPKITETKYLAFVHYCGYFTKGDPILITEFEIERAAEGKRLGKKNSRGCHHLDLQIYAHRSFIWISRARNINPRIRNRALFERQEK